MDKNALDRGDVLGDSESTLRQVASVLSGLCDGTEATTSTKDQGVVAGRAETKKPSDLPELLDSIGRAYNEIVGMISSLQESRGILESAAMSRLKHTNEKLKEVSSATEMATTGIMDGIDRALSMVGSLGEMAGSSEEEESVEVRSNLEEELHGIMTLLQFQDITAQQLGYASGVLTDIEQRLVRIAEVFERSGLWSPKENLEEETKGANGNSGHFPEDCDPNASTLDGEGRQALADEIFTTPGA